MHRLIFGFFLRVTVASLLVCCALQVNGQGKIVTASQVNGTWQYRDNVFRIWAMGQQKLKLEFDGAYVYKVPSGPTANLGFGEGIARIEGDTAIFKPSGIGEDEDCKITMRFTKGKLIVNQDGICGFGHNVTAAGTYRRVSRAKPKFGESVH